MFICKAATMMGLKNVCKTEDPVMLQKFVDHTNTHGLSYGTKEEFQFRMDIFAKKDEVIENHNAKDSSFKLGHNQFSTWTEEEYNNLTPAHCEVRTETHTRWPLTPCRTSHAHTHPPLLPRQVRMLLETGKGLPGLDAKGEPGECMARPGPGWDHKVEKDPDAL